jgi:hypothetical protein
MDSSNYGAHADMLDPLMCERPRTALLSLGAWHVKFFWLPTHLGCPTLAANPPNERKWHRGMWAERGPCAWFLQDRALII